MAKTTFVQGTIVQPAWLNSVFAHNHNAQDDDGHCPRINLTDAAEVSGVLPVANQVDHVHNGIERNKINPDSHILNCYPGMFSASFVGFTTSIQVALSYRINEYNPYTDPRFPKVVEVYIPEIYGVSNSTQFYASGAIPANIRPAISGATGSCFVSVVNGGSVRQGVIHFNWDGSITLSICQVSGSEIAYNSSGWAATGAKGIYATCIKYPIF